MSEHETPPLPPLPPSETPLTPAQIAQCDTQVDHEGYFARLLRDADIFGDELLDGQTDETTSARLQRWKDTKPAGSIQQRVGALGSDLLDMIEKQHGQLAEEADKERARDLIRVEPEHP